jgi:hypothetical protein
VPHFLSILQPSTFILIDHEQLRTVLQHNLPGTLNLGVEVLKRIVIQPDYASLGVSPQTPRDPDAFAVVSGLHPAPTNRNELAQPLIEFGAQYGLGR